LNKITDTNKGRQCREREVGMASALCLKNWVLYSATLKLNGCWGHVTVDAQKRPKLGCCPLCQSLYIITKVSLNFNINLKVTTYTSYRCHNFEWFFFCKCFWIFCVNSLAVQLLGVTEICWCWGLCYGIVSLFAVLNILIVISVPENPSMHWGVEQRFCYC
jgi:hypothetical protein